MSWNKMKRRSQQRIALTLVGLQILSPSSLVFAARIKPKIKANTNTPLKLKSGASEVAKVLFLQGIVRVDKKKATDPVDLRLGSVIETGKGHATVRIGKDQVVDMDEDSRLRIVMVEEKKTGAGRQLGVVLEKGGLRGAQDRRLRQMQLI